MLFLDVETQSELNLADGYSSAKYAQHPSTHVLCLAYAFADEDVQVWLPDSEPIPSHLEHYRGIVVAHNISFERAIFRYCLGIDPDQFEYWICTAAIARVNGLPGKLDDASRWLGYGDGKDKIGRAAMLKLSKPRRTRKKETELFDGLQVPVFFHNDPEAFKDLIRYCKLDVDLSRKIFSSQKHLQAREADIFNFDRHMNERGIKIDLPRVRRLLALVEHAKNEAIESVGFNVKSNQQFLAACLDRGVHLENCQADYLNQCLSDPAFAEVSDLINAKLLVSKTSTSKLQKILIRTDEDGRCRENLIYYGAHTGRFSGVGIQAHNFPRGTIGAQEVERLLAMDDEALKLIHGDRLPTICASALRSCITAGEGRTLFAGDFSAIEARVNFWLAGQTDALDLYRGNADLYRLMAGRVFDRPPSEVAFEQRQLGKMLVLGAGFGMGPPKFVETCRVQAGLKISPDLAQRSIKAYREKFARIPALWKGLENAAVRAIQRPGEVQTYGRIKYRFDEKTAVLAALLPSGRIMRYQRARIVSRETPWQELRPAVRHLSKLRGGGWAEVDTYGGRLCENAVQATARDIMTEAMLRVDRAGFPVVLTVHDEIVSEAEPDSNLDKFKFFMQGIPEWAEGLPIAVECWAGERYRK